MTLDINLSTLLQGLALAVLCAMGRLLYNGVVLQSALTAKLDAHTEQDAANFERLHNELSEIRERM